MKNSIGNGLFFAPVILALAFGCASVHTDEDGAGTGVWVADWRRNIFQDTTMPADGTMSINLAAAKNDVEPFQINIRSGQSGTITGVTFSADI